MNQALRFAFDLWRMRTITYYRGRVQRDLLDRRYLRSTNDNPYPLYDDLLAGPPLVRSRKGKLVAARYGICQRILRDRRWSVRMLDAPAPTEHQQGALDLSFLERDPPDHTRLRRLAAPAFSPKMMTSYESRIEEIAHRLIDDVQRKDTFDLMRDFAAPLPIAVISELLGIPDADSERFTRYGAAIGQALDGVQSLRHARELMVADKEIRSLFSQLMELREREPGDDVISQLTTARADEKLTTYELMTMCQLLLIAGFETTVNLIGNGTLALLDNREHWEALCADASLADNIVEETLRYDSPVQATERVSTTKTEIDGVPVDRGDIVVLMLGGANRDPRVFDDPATFDPHRKAGVDHLAFSGGLHYCLGAPLARLEGQTAFRVLAERLPELQRVGRCQRRRSVTIRGVATFPVSARH